MSFLVSLLPLAACVTGTIEVDTDTPGSETGDSQGSTPVEFTDLTWRLHPEVEALVYTSWTQNVPDRVHVEYRFDKGDWRSSPAHDADAGTQEQILVGIPFETEAEWRVVSETGVPAPGPNITTGPLPGDLPVAEIVTYDEAGCLPGGNYYLGTINERNGGWTGGDYWTFIMDREGRMVWAHLAPDNHWSLYATVAVTKDYFMWDESTYWSDYDEGAGSKIHKAWLDEEIEGLDTPGLHHAFVQLPDGTLAWGSQDHGGYEALVERAPGQEDETVLWSCEDDWPGSGRCESNGLYYDPGTDTFLYSFYTNNSIVEVDRRTGASDWWAGGVNNGYAFDPTRYRYSWQHGVSWTAAGTLLVSSYFQPDSGASETWLLEYEVDRTSRVLNYVWGNSSGTRADTNGDAWRLANGNTLHTVGSAAVAREVTPDGVDVWRADFGGTKLLGRGELIEDLYTLVKPRESGSAD